MPSPGRENCQSRPNLVSPVSSSLLFRNHKKRSYLARLFQCTQLAQTDASNRHVQDLFVRRRVNGRGPDLEGGLGMGNSSRSEQVTEDFEQLFVGLACTIVPFFPLEAPP